MQFPSSVKFVIIFFGFVLFFYVLYVGSGLAIPLFIALLFSLLMLPFCNWMERKGMSRGWASFLSILALALLLSGLIWFMAWQIQNLVKGADQAKEKFTSSIKEVQGFFESSLGIDQQSQQEYLDNLREQMGEGMFSNVMSATGTFLMALILIPMSMFFMLYFRRYYEKFLYKLHEEHKHEKIRNIIHQEKKIIVQYITGIFTVVLILAVCNTIALSVIGLDNALFFAVVAALMNIIPLVGTFVGSIIPVLYAVIMEDALWMPVVIALYFWFIQILESNIITPNVVGSRVRVNPYMIILAIFFGEQIWGAAGMVLFIPMLAIVKVLCKLIEPLEPFGFLLTDPHEDQEGIIRKAFNKIKSKFKK